MTKYSTRVADAKIQQQWSKRSLRIFESGKALARAIKETI